jgi:D-amino-acid dehydrogenase
LVVGGGVIGLACAHYLVDAGLRVTLIDKGRIGAACSHRNCGLVCPSHVLPLATPGAIRSSMKAMLSPGGAFRIRPRLSTSLWRWMWKFALRCNRGDMLSAGRGIQALLSSSLELYRGLMAKGELECEWQDQGLLFVYRNQEPLDAYAAENELLANEFDEGARRLGPDELRELEPSVADGLAGAWYYEEDAHLRPERLLESWRASLEARGVRIVEQQELEAFVSSAGTVTAARVSGDLIEADAFVVATGAWTPHLQRTLRCRVPIEPGKGYSVIVPRPSVSPRIPMIFPEHRVVVTPFEQGMRIGSIMEFAGWDDSISPDRLRLLTDGAKHYLRDPVLEPVSKEWYGWRPMTYDSKPIIGPCPRFANVFLATGHNMLGLSMAPATGRLITELITGTEPHVKTAPYSVDRFIS